MRVYLCIDFEAINQQGDWWAYGCMLAHYHNGAILESIESYCDRSPEEFDAATREFWDTHPEARDRIKQKAVGLDRETEEKRLCDFIQSVFSQQSSVHVVTDNPQFDLRLLDNLLVKHGFPVIAMRAGCYVHSVCSVSYRHGALSGIGKETWDRVSGLVKDSAYYRPVARYQGLHHCPLFDCARILASHFNTMDIIYLYRQNPPSVSHKWKSNKSSTR